MSLFSKLWSLLPENTEYPCDKSKYGNQCAIRMSVALQSAGIDMTSCSAVKCDYHLTTHTKVKHYLRAQELATWFEKKSVFGKTYKYSRQEINKRGYKDIFDNRQGVIFIQDGWGPTDHVDLWNGNLIKNGSLNYFNKGVAIWFWEIL